MENSEDTLTLSLQLVNGKIVIVGEGRGRKVPTLHRKERSRQGFSKVVWSSMAIDKNSTSPFVNTIYIAAVIITEPMQSQNQVLVARSSDGGTTWQAGFVAPAQISPDVDSYTAMAIGGDGTVYLTWMYCNQGPYFCDDN